MKIINIIFLIVGIVSSIYFFETKELFLIGLIFLLFSLLNIVLLFKYSLDEYSVYILKAMFISVILSYPFFWLFSGKYILVLFLLIIGSFLSFFIKELRGRKNMGGFDGCVEESLSYEDIQKKYDNYKMN